MSIDDCWAAIASRLGPTGIQYIRQMQVGCQAAIVGTPPGAGSLLQ